MGRSHCGGSISPWVLALVIFAGVLWTDATIKVWAQESLTEPVRVTSWLFLATQHNTGIFLGSLPVSSISFFYWFFVGIALICLGWRMMSANHLPIGAGYALMTGGLLGNALSRIDGAVVDFLGFGPLIDGKWAFANVADFAMLGGLALLGVVLVRGKVRARREGPA